MKQIITIFTILSTIFIGCSQKENPQVGISTSIPPQKYFIKHLLGQETEVNVMVMNGNNHANYEPTPQQLKAIAQSKVYVKIGDLGFETIWLPKIIEVNPSIKLINLSQDIDPIEGEEGCTDHHAAEHGHSNDPHIWTSPKSVKTSMLTLANELIKIYPQKRDTILTNLSNFTAKLDTLDHQLKTISQTSKRKSFLIFHPGYTYLARDYGLEQLAIEKDGKEPSASNMAQIIAACKLAGIKTVFIQMEFDKRNAELIAKEINGSVVVVNPMNEDWLLEMQKMIAHLNTALN